MTIDSAAEPKTTRAAGGVAAAASEGTAKVDFERQAHYFPAANVPQKRAAASNKKAVPKKRTASTTTMDDDYNEEGARYNRSLAILTAFPRKFPTEQEKEQLLEQTGLEKINSRTGSKKIVLNY